ncbi:GNAT family N-acetyltransferase [Thauera sp. SDU_THAU2]|uniref:GNAT family N-acetyltransferase n=1 Tax=Thauera sp. SDU_THAU2 TaxID=3136633 RepID=UPI0031204733
MSTSLASRLGSTFRQFGWKEGSIYLLGKGLSQATGGRLRLIRYHLVAQPVPPSSEARPLPPGSRTSIEFISPGAPVISQFPRPSKVIERRFANGDRCITAQTDGRFAGYIWLARNQYDEDTVRCLYRLADPAHSAWDYDVYVDTDFRMGRTFSRLWASANQQLASEGVRWSFSRIAAANPQSLDSHRRLGIRKLFSASFIKADKWQLMLAGARPYIHLSVSEASRPTLDVHPPQTDRS